MSETSAIVEWDEEITRCLRVSRETAATDLFERYRVAGEGRETFVAALIARLCVLETVSAFRKDSK